MLNFTLVEISTYPVMVLYRFHIVIFLCFLSTTAKDRMTNEEKRALDRANNYIYQEVRQAAEAHRQVQTAL